MDRGCIAEIDLSALSLNLKVIRRMSRGVPLIAVVKADAYGHGSLEVARKLVRNGAECLAVAFTGEAKELREGGITAPILVLFDSDVPEIIRYDLVPVISDPQKALELSRAAKAADRQVPVHVKLDTGMGRLGITGDAVREISQIAGLDCISVEGVMSHFSEADLRDGEFAAAQISKFSAVKNALSGAGIGIKFFHMANSAAVMTLPDAHFDAVRPGLMLYGYSPLQKTEDRQKGEGNRQDVELIPVMTVKTRIISLRRLPAGSPVSYGRTFVTKGESLIGVISAGYADGFSRKFSNNAEVLVRGKRAPVVGRVCMDLAMIDVSGVEGVEEGDEIVIIGGQGKESIDACELADRAGTIPYEILTSLGRMSRRRYL